MSTLTDDVRSAVRGASCYVADQVTSGSSFGDSIFVRDFRRIPGGETATDYWSNRATGLRDWICNDGPESGAPVPQSGGSFPFTGGQCETEYNVLVEGSAFVSFFNERRDTLGTVRVNGPVTGVFVQQNGDIISWTVESADPTVQATSITASIGTVSDGTTDNVTITRVDDQPDNCGDAGIPIADGPMWRLPLPNPDDPNQPGVDIDVGFPIVIIGPGGEISFNFGVQIGALNLNYTYSPGAGDPEATEPQDPYDCCPPVDDLGEDAPDTPDDPDEPPTPLRFDAVICSVSPRPIRPGAATEKGNGIGPSIYLPSLAEIRFAVQTPRGNAWSKAVKIQGLKEVIDVPTRYPAYNWAVDEYQGVPITVTPLYNREDPNLDE